MDRQWRHKVQVTALFFIVPLLLLLLLLLLLRDSSNVLHLMVAKWTLATYLNVCHPMIVEIGAGRESLPTDWALVRLLSRVDPPMRVQRAGRAEPFAAHSAHMRLFTCELITRKTRNVNWLLIASCDSKSIQMIDQLLVPKINENPVD